MRTGDDRLLLVLIHIADGGLCLALWDSAGRCTTGPMAGDCQLRDELLRMLNGTLLGGIVGLLVGDSALLDGGENLGTDSSRLHGDSLFILGCNQG